MNHAPHLVNDQHYGYTSNPCSQSHIYPGNSDLLRKDIVMGKKLVLGWLLDGDLKTPRAYHLGEDPDHPSSTIN